MATLNSKNIGLQQDEILKSIPDETPVTGVHSTAHGKVELSTAGEVKVAINNMRDWDMLFWAPSGKEER